MSDNVPPSPSKREARKQDRRLAILCVAKRTFLENGYSGTSMSAIAAELGGSKATLWGYFPSKEDLFSAVLDEATRAYRQQLTDLLKPSDDVRATLVEFARGFLTKITSPDALRLHRLVASEVGRAPEVGDIFYRRAPQRTRQLLTEFIAAAMAAGQLRDEDPADAARVMTALCTGGLHQRMLWGQDAATPERIETEAQRAVEVFLRAFGV
ncbi:TetR/AcrR family transcriptional regulator [Sphingomonas sp. S2-65]|uniref:TetR/AcrR family transcriptional regulator n=1 Tax=Sphingomonas sp. S2-65 TaxID=2903960 RepID=UPI001F275F1C|nr:TetR/AcrR family transcriptional regulator [Sphingomonas sp. S2-65]UYY59200.1 TetR/AcrR family transcriptional regulator [Sphingomonas sp. S2-65]